MKKFLSIILCLITAISVCTLVSCGDKNAVGEVWNVVPYTLDDGATATDQIVGFKLTRNSVNVKEVWINVKKITGETVDVTFQKYTTKSSDGGATEITLSGTVLGGSARTITAEEVKKANKDSKGWIKVNVNDWNVPYNDVAMIVKGNIVIREVVFVNTKGEIITTALDKADVVIETGDRIINKTFTKAELESFVDVENGLPTYLLDSQESFKDKDQK